MTRIDVTLGALAMIALALTAVSPWFALLAVPGFLNSASKMGDRSSRYFEAEAYRRITEPRR